jgi:hemoglobin/transferrin/lactoferrin receptor protein
MKFFASCALLLLLYSSARGQQITVLDKTDLQPIPFASITTTDRSKGVKTNTIGKADISLLQGSDHLVVSANGYRTITLSFSEVEEVNFVIKLSEDQIEGEEVVVSANKWEQKRSEIANRVISVEPREVAFQNPQTAGDLLSLTKEVYVQKSQLAGGSPMIRGFSTNRVLLVVDGIRMNNAIFRSGNLQNVISLDANATENVEVVFGPGSVIYGSDAIGGVMDFHTLGLRYGETDALMMSGSALARYSSAATEKTGHLDLSLGTKEFASVTSVSFSDYNDLVMGSKGFDEYQRLEYVERINGVDSIVANTDPDRQVASGFSQLNLIQKFGYNVSNNFDLSMSVQYSRSSDAQRYDRLIEYRNNKLRYAEWYYGPQVWGLGSLTAIMRNGGFFDAARLVAAYQRFEESRHDRSRGSSSFREQYESVNAYSFNADFDKALTPSSWLFFGAEGVTNAVGSVAHIKNINDGSETASPTRYPDGSTWTSAALYASYKHNFNELYVLNAGVRYNYVTSHSAFDTTFYPFPYTTADLANGAVTGSLGLTWLPSELTQLNLNGATGFRAPNIDDVGKVFESEPGNVLVPNPDLKPEYAYSAEFGIIQRIGTSIRIDASTFYSIVTDALARRDFTFNGQDSIMYDGELSQVQAMQNVSEATSYGVQLALTLQILNDLSLKGNITYIQGEENDDATGEVVPLRHAPPIFAGAALTYNGEGIKAEISVDHSAEVSYDDLAPSERSKTFIYAKDENGNPYSPAWTLVNLKGSYQLTDKIQINAGIENILDDRYRPYSSGIVAPGRNFILGVRTYF